ncbi:MAG: YgjV family protein [Eubacterium sp.]|nr:YgjV family protein [Eubacterium sp.]
MFLIAQIIGWVGTVVNTAAFQIKNTKGMILMQALAGVIFGTHYLLLGAVTAGLIQFIFTINILLLSANSDDWKSWKGWKWVISGIVVIISAVTWSGILSIIPCACSIIATITNWSRNGRTIRMYRLFVLSPLWIFYDILVHSYPGIVLELIAMGSVIVSFVRYGVRELSEA